MSQRHLVVFACGCCSVFQEFDPDCLCPKHGKGWASSELVRQSRDPMRRRNEDARIAVPTYQVQVGLGKLREFNAFWPALRYFIACWARQAFSFLDRRGR